MEYDYIVVGAGLSGGIIARELARKYNKKILIVEKRNHIGGNIFDYVNEYGIKIQKYGPHVLHTNNDDVYNYIKQFCTPVEYKTKCEAVIDNICTPSPFNFKTIDQFYNVEEAEILKKKLKDYYPNRNTVAVVEMLQSDDECIRKYAYMLFEKDYKLYTAKQWGIEPSKIDVSVLKRVPIVLSYGDTYFYDKYEFMPKDGFTKMYESIIDDSNIDIKLNEDALRHISFDEKNNKILWDGNETRIIYTGPIDELFNNKYGELPYRSLRFEFISMHEKSFQTSAIVVYPQEKEFTRITEYSKMPFQIGEWTTYAKEYPSDYFSSGKNKNEPYYPVLTENSKKINELYQNEATKYNELTICGRLAEFKYYNMDQIILRALEVFGIMEEKYGTKI